MHPIIYAALAQEHRQTLLDEAARARLAALANAARSDATHTAHARRVVIHPLLAFHGWLARGYL